MLEHESNLSLDKELKALYTRLEFVKPYFEECYNRIRANKLFTKLITNGGKPNFNDMSDQDFNSMACSALTSSTLNLLPDDDKYSYLSIAENKEILGSLDRNGLEEALYHMLSARNYILSDEVVWYAINISLAGRYNDITENLRVLGYDIEKLPDECPEKKDLLARFNELKQETQANIISNKKPDVEHCCKMCIEAFLKNLHEKPDDNLGFDSEARLKMVISALEGYDVVLDLREMDLRNIGRHFKEMDIENVKILLTPEQEDEYLSSEQRDARLSLFSLVKSGNAKELEQVCLTGHRNVNIENSQGRTALMLACTMLDVAMVQVLLELGADPNIKTKTGWSVIEGLLRMERCEEKSVIIDLLGQHKANVSDLHIAAGVMDLSQSTIIYPATSLNQMIHDYAPIHIAAINGHTTNIGWLLAKGVNIDLQNGMGDTALYSACERGDKDVVVFLLDMGADFSLKCNGDAPVKIALKNGHDEIVKELLQRGAIMDENTVESIPAGKRQSLIVHIFLAEFAGTTKSTIEEIKCGTILQHNLMLLAGFDFKQNMPKLEIMDGKLGCYINFSCKEDVHKFKSFHAKIITSCSMPNSIVAGVHFELDADALHNMLIPKSKESSEEKCLVM